MHLYIHFKVLQQIVFSRSYFNIFTRKFFCQKESDLILLYVQKVIIQRQTSQLL